VSEWDWLAEPRATVSACSPWMNPRRDCRRHLRGLLRAGDTESLCRRCGDCCHLSIKLPRPSGPVRILVPGLVCKFLRWDGDTATCEVYEERAAKAPWCNNTENGLMMGLYTAGCGYVQGAGWYRGSERIPDELLPHLLPEVRECLRGPFRSEDIERFFRRWERP